MQRGVGGTAFQTIEQRRDTEIVLGPAMLALVGLALFALCALCFVFGYAVGHRNAESNPSSAALPSPDFGQSGNPPAKPAAGQGGVQPMQSVPATDPSASETAGPSPASTSEPANAGAAYGSGAPAAANPGQPSSQSPIRTVVAGQPSAAQPAQSGSVQPALSQSSAVVVRIAAVSHPEDAEVLVSALRKRGYAVTARRDPADGLLHVQIGPFANRNDALTVRQKLLNDGYNAILEP